MERARRINPIAATLFLVGVAVLLTFLCVYIWGGRLVTLPDGSKFLGKFENGQPVKGEIIYSGDLKAELDYYNKTIAFSNGDIYVGDILDGCPHGVGKKSYYTTGDTYEGDFYYSEIHGNGTFTYSNGDVFTGSFVNSVKQGYGTFVYANGNSYKGYYENDLRHGEGTFIWASGAKYTGTFVNNLKEGTGVMIYANGDRYEGGFMNDKRHGDRCVYRWANGERYNGSFRDNVMDTRAVDENGNYITDGNGEYVHLEMATYTFTTGRSYRGYFVSGKAEGVTLG